MYKKVAIIGFGRFGKVLYDILKDDFEILLYDINRDAFKGAELSKEDKIVKDIRQIYQINNITIFFAVPISKFEKVIKKHSKYFKPSHLVIDVLSVKLWPKKVFDIYLKNSKTKAILTHPMFGPDSIKLAKKALPFVFDRYTADQRQYEFWKRYFTKKGFEIIELSAKEHDKLAANSQGVTHLIGRILEEFKFKPTVIDTQGAKALHTLMTQTCNDTWELFKGLQNFNPYTTQMRIKFLKSYKKVSKKLQKKNSDRKEPIFGIQGGRGSFNEQALSDYVLRHKITSYKVKYLYTTKRVLSALEYGKIDFGLFAIHNSTGGIVDESIKALAKYEVNIVEEFAIKIEHFLMKRMDVDFDKITTIMAHPQVFKQCKKNLKKKYLNYNMISGKGDLIDHAKVAEALHNGKLPFDTAVMGPKILSRIYELDVVDGPLQDLDDNFTSFLMVRKLIKNT